MNDLCCNCRRIEAMTGMLWKMVYQSMSWRELKRAARRHGYSGKTLKRHEIVTVMVRREKYAASIRWSKLVSAGYFENPPA